MNQARIAQINRANQAEARALMLKAIHAIVQGIAQNPGRIAKRLKAVGIIVTWNERTRKLE